MRCSTSSFVIGRMPSGKAKKAGSNREKNSERDRDKDNVATAALERAMFANGPVEEDARDESLEELQRKVQKAYLEVVANENNASLTQRHSIQRRSILLECLPVCAARQHAIARFQLTGTTPIEGSRKADTQGCGQ